MTAAEKIYSNVLTNSSWTITKDMGLRSISFVLVSGAGIWKGDLNIGALVSNPVPLQIGVPIKISSDNTYPLDGVTLDCTAGGVIDVMARQ